MSPQLPPSALPWPSCPWAGLQHAAMCPAGRRSPAGAETPSTVSVRQLAGGCATSSPHHPRLQGPRPLIIDVDGLRPQVHQPPLGSKQAGAPPRPPGLAPKSSPLLPLPGLGGALIPGRRKANTTSLKTERRVRGYTPPSRPEGHPRYPSGSGVTQPWHLGSRASALPGAVGTWSQASSSFTPWAEPWGYLPAVERVCQWGPLTVRPGATGLAPSGSRALPPRGAGRCCSGPGGPARGWECRPPCPPCSPPCRLAAVSPRVRPLPPRATLASGRPLLTPVAQAGSQGPGDSVPWTHFLGRLPDPWLLWLFGGKQRHRAAAVSAQGPGTGAHWGHDGATTWCGWEQGQSPPSPVSWTLGDAVLSPAELQVDSDKPGGADRVDRAPDGVGRSRPLPAPAPGPAVRCMRPGGSAAGCPRDRDQLLIAVQLSFKVIPSPLPRPHRATSRPRWCSAPQAPLHSASCPDQRHGGHSSRQQAPGSHGAALHRDADDPVPGVPTPPGWGSTKL